MSCFPQSVSMTKRNNIVLLKNKHVLVPNKIPSSHLFSSDDVIDIFLNGNPLFFFLISIAPVVTQFKILNLNSRYRNNSTPNVKVLAARLRTKGWGWQSWRERK
jgi:hypothetical protein